MMLLFSLFRVWPEVKQELPMTDWLGIAYSSYLHCPWTFRTCDCAKHCTLDQIPSEFTANSLVGLSRSVLSSQECLQPAGRGPRGPPMAFPGPPGPQYAPPGVYGPPGSRFARPRYLPRAPMGRDGGRSRLSPMGPKGGRGPAGPPPPPPQPVSSAIIGNSAEQFRPLV